MLLGLENLWKMPYLRNDCRPTDCPIQFIMKVGEEIKTFVMFSRI